MGKRRSVAWEDPKPIAHQQHHQQDIPVRSYFCRRQRINKAPSFCLRLAPSKSALPATFLKIPQQHRVEQQCRKFHASVLLKNANVLLLHTDKIPINFSNGWMERFKKRYSLKFRRIPDEAMGTNQSAIARDGPRIELIIMTYRPCNVCNADELGLFYCQPPSWMLSDGLVSGFKKEKTNITFLFCWNTYDNERMPLTIIGLL